MPEAYPGALKRFSRRRFLKGAGMGAAALAFAPHVLRASSDRGPILGSGEHTYEWVRGWGSELPEGNTHGCVRIDSQGRIFVNSDTEHAVIVFDPDGKIIKTWGKEFKGGIHGMAFVKEGKDEHLFFVHHSRHQVVKATLDGQVLMILEYPKESGVYKDASEYRPASVAIGPNGDIYVSDGYGLSWIHQYNSKGEYIRSWGGKGTEPGKMRTPHGIWIDTRQGSPVLGVCDRENNRLQFFSLDGKYLSMVTEELRRPCHAFQKGDELVIADLAGRVTIFDKNNKLITHLGDNPDPNKRANNKVPRDQWVDGQFIAPHCACWDDEGNMYVLEWLALGRVVKLKRLKT